LHDNLGHLASLIKINLTTIKASDVGFEEKLEDIRNLTRRLMTDLKRLSVRLSDDPVIYNGLIHAIENEIEQLNKTGKYTAKLLVSGSIPVIENDKAIIVYRMVQEVMSNFTRHSDGSELKINILYMDNFISLELSDNGNGFNLDEQRKDGAGLRNLKYRASLIGASLEIISAVGHGTTTIIKFPYSNHGAAFKISAS
jgi:signal transduction histidine kinase